MKNNLLKNITKYPEVVKVLDSCPNLVIADNTKQLLDLACGDAKQDFFRANTPIRPEEIKDDTGFILAKYII